MKNKHNLKRQAFDKFFESLLVNLAVHDLKLKQQPKVESTEPVIEFVAWIK